MNTARMLALARELWTFLGFFQPPLTRILHALVVLGVGVQILTGLVFASLPAPADHTVLPWHVWPGLVTLVLALVLTAHSLATRGLRRFFPYLWGDFKQIRVDLDAIRARKLVAPRPGGLATAVQGLGLGALLLATGSGGLWLLCSRLGLPDFAHAARSAHQGLVLLLELYCLGHGGMALLHFAVWRKRVVRAR